MKKKVKMRKERLRQLLLQRNAVQAISTTTVVWYPVILQLKPPVPKDLPKGTTLLVKEWLLWTAKKKETGEEFKTYDLVDVNGGLWYGIPIFTFWHDQVDKGSMPEPDMEQQLHWFIQNT